LKNSFNQSTYFQRNLVHPFVVKTIKLNPQEKSIFSPFFAIFAQRWLAVLLLPIFM